MTFIIFNSKYLFILQLYIKIYIYLLTSCHYCYVMYIIISNDQIAYKFDL